MQVVGEGFEPSKAEPTGLQPVPFDRSGIPPGGGQFSDQSLWTDGPHRERLCGWQHRGVERPVLIAGDDGVPVRVREELAGAGVATVSICSSAEVRAARAAAAAGARVVIGDVSAGGDVGGGGARATRGRSGSSAPDDLANLSAALQVADEAPEVRIVVRLFSADLAEGVEAMLGGRGTVLSEIEVAAPALIQAALSGNEGQRVTVGGRILEVAEVDRDDPALVVALCDVDTPTEVLPPRDRLGRHVLGAGRPRRGGQRRTRRAARERRAVPPGAAAAPPSGALARRPCARGADARSRGGRTR